MLQRAKHLLLAELMAQDTAIGETTQSSRKLVINKHKR